MKTTPRFQGALDYVLLWTFSPLIALVYVGFRLSGSNGHSPMSGFFWVSVIVLFAHLLFQPRQFLRMATVPSLFYIRALSFGLTQTFLIHVQGSGYIGVLLLASVIGAVLSIPIASKVLGEKLSRVDYLAAAFVIVAFAVDRSIFAVGLLALVGGALNMTMVLTSRMVRPTRTEMIRVVSLSYLAAFGLAGAYLAYLQPTELNSPPQVSPILILSVVGSIFIQYVFFYLSVRFPVRITAFSGLLMVPSAIVADFVFFGFTPTASRLGCAVIILAMSVFRLLTREKGRAISPEVAPQVVAPNAT